MKKKIPLLILALIIISGVFLGISYKEKSVNLSDFKEYTENYKLESEQVILIDYQNDYDNLIEECNNILNTKKTKDISKLQTRLVELKTNIINSNRKTILDELVKISDKDYSSYPKDKQEIINDNIKKINSLLSENQFRDANKSLDELKDFLKKNDSTAEISKNIREHKGFVLLKDIDDSLIFDIRYATTNNFTGKVVYPTKICVLRTKTAYKLERANELLKAQGYKIKVYDAYRPLSVQQIFWDLVQDSNYVANPNTGGSIHNKGCAVDITMVDLNGNDTEMPSEFDDFSEKASRSSTMSDAARNNLEILTNAMVNVGFQTISSEWWHFESADKALYDVVDIDLNLFSD